jgi:hypothetical protein
MRQSFYLFGDYFDSAASRDQPEWISGHFSQPQKPSGQSRLHPIQFVTFRPAAMHSDCVSLCREQKEILSWRIFTARENKCVALNTRHNKKY